MQDKTIRPSASAQRPLISVAIIAYNQRKFLGELLDSVLTQDYPNLEVIVADDASTDGTSELREEYERKHPGRVIWLFAKTNGGVTANANAGLQRCTGEYFCLVGGDDIFLPGKISAQVEWFRQHPDGALCACSVEVFDSQTGQIIHVVDDPVLRRGGGVGAMIRQSCATPTSAFMFRKSHCEGVHFDRRTPVVCDWLFIIEACVRGRYGKVDGTYLRYRRTGENLTALGEERSYIEDRLIYTDIFFARYRQYYYSLKIQRSNIFYLHGKRAGYAGKPRSAAQFMIYALGEWPFTTAAWLGLVLSGLSLMGMNGWLVGRRVSHLMRGIKTGASSITVS
jgi:glycosyltransferase involved in cell wall biosynthesis